MTLALVSPAPNSAPSATTHRDEPNTTAAALPPARPPWSSTGAIAAAVFGLLLSVYLLAFGGKLHSLDEYSTLSSASSLVKTGTLRNDQMAWAWAGDYSQDALGIDGHLYSKKGLGVALWVAPFYALGLALPGAGLAHAGLLASAVASAVGGMAVYCAGMALTRRVARAAWLALLYGLGTIILPYSKYLFSEGLASAAMAVAVLGLSVHLCTNDERRRWLLLAGAGAAASMLARPVGALAAPFAVAAIAWAAVSRHGRRLRAITAPVAAYLLPVVAGLAVMALANWLRFGNPLSTGFAAGESFSAPFWEGFRGLVLSPGKSLFLYSPPLFLALVGIPTAARRWPRFTAFALATAVAHVLLYSTWYGWDGGWCWGPRFLIPIVPLLMPLALPAIDRLLRGGVAGRIVLGSLAAVSVLVQIAGACADYVEFNNSLIAQGIPTGLYYDWRYNPILGQLMVLNPLRLRANMLDLGWLRVSDGHANLRWAPLALALTTLAATGYCLATLLRGRGKRRHVCVMVVAPLVSLCLSLPLYGDDPWYQDQVESGPALEALAPRLRSGDAVAVEVLPYIHFYGQAAYLLNTSRLTVPTLILLRREPEVGALEQQLLTANLEDSGRLWLLLGATPVGHQASTTERWCAERAYLVEQVWLSGSTRAALFDAGGNAAPLASAQGGPLGDGIALDGYRVSVRRSTGENEPSTVLVELDWSASATPSRSYAVFVQLLGPDGLPIAQADSRPLGGLEPTESWQPGQRLTDRYAIDVPDGARGQHRLIAGMYDPASGVRLPTRDGDHFFLANIPLDG